MTYQVLDCTLRDGGYYTDWDFDDELVDLYVDNLAKLPLAAVEIGYCSHPSPGYKGQWAYLNRAKLAKVKARLAPDQELAVMLDAKDTSPDRVTELVGDLVGVVDMVRMAVAPNQFEHGLALARVLKGLGFRVGFNTMYLSTYDKDCSELEVLRDAGDAIDVLALVDSYGGCTPDTVRNHIGKAVSMFPNIAVGFHGHDNTCLAYANTLAALEAGAQSIDATFVGMGRGAGNTRTEMLLVHKASLGEDVDFDACAQIVDRFEELRAIYGWGANLPYMLSGATSLPQKDVMDWLGKNRYSPVSVVRALKNQGGEDADQREFPELRPNSLALDEASAVIVIGGGDSVEKHREALCTFVERRAPIVIHANTRHLDLIDDLGANQVVCLPGNAATKLPTDVDLDNVAGFVVAVPPRFSGTVPADLPRPVFQTGTFTASGELGPISDLGPLDLALGAARTLNAKRIYLIGFDGYPTATVAQQELATETQNALDRIQAEPDVKVYSLTPTLYALPTWSLYAEVV